MHISAQSLYILRWPEYILAFEGDRNKSMQSFNLIISKESERASWDTEMNDWWNISCWRERNLLLFVTLRKYSPGPSLKVVSNIKNTSGLLQWLTIKIFMYSQCLLNSLCLDYRLSLFLIPFYLSLLGKGELSSSSSCFFSFLFFCLSFFSKTLPVAMRANEHLLRISDQNRIVRFSCGGCGHVIIFLLISNRQSLLDIC